MTYHVDVKRALLAILLLPSLAFGDPIIGERAPPLSAEKLDDQVLLVDFFATWCEPCHLAMAALDDIARRRGVRLIVVDVGEPPETVNAWFAAHPPPPGTRVVLDPKGEAARRWGQHRFPTTFVLGMGAIRHINRGYGSGYAMRLDHWVAGLQDEPH